MILRPREAVTLATGGGPDRLLRRLANLDTQAHTQAQEAQPLVEELPVLAQYPRLMTMGRPPTETDTKTKHQVNKQEGMYEGPQTTLLRRELPRRLEVETARLLKQKKRRPQGRKKRIKTVTDEEGAEAAQDMQMPQVSRPTKVLRRRHHEGREQDKEMLRYLARV